MDTQQILSRAIQRAIDNGWLPYFAQFDANMTKDTIIIRYPEGVASVNFDYQMKGHIVGVGGYNMEPYSIIFNHDFAKALWGGEIIPNEYIGAYENKEPGDWVKTYTTRPAWQTHLQQMVIAPDPIQYLANHLDKEGA